PLYSAWQQAKGDVSTVSDIPNKYGGILGALNSIVTQLQQNGWNFDAINWQQAVAAGEQTNAICQSNGTKILSQSEANGQARELITGFNSYFVGKYAGGIPLPNTTENIDATGIPTGANTEGISLPLIS